MRLFRFVILLVTVAIVVFPAGIALSLAYEPPADPVRALSDTVERGETFNVTVNFTAPADNFTAISLNDFAPAGWNVTASGSWSQPSAQVTKDNNSVQFGWVGGTGGYDNGTNFTALYKVTVPCGDELGNYTFGDGFLGYYIGNDTTHYYEFVTGDFNVTLVGPAICSPPSIPFYTPVGQNPENETLDVWSSTPCMLNWSLSDDVGWLEEYPTNGTCTDVHSSVNLSVNSSGMPIGDYTANITIESPDANNSPRTVLVTLHINVTGILEGQVAFTGRGDPPDNKWIEPFVVRVFSNATHTEMPWSPMNATTNNTGVFTSTGITAGTYDIGIKNATCLSKMVTNVTINAGMLTVVDFGGIREGDVNNDDKCNILDLSAVGGAFGSSEGGEDWNAGCDFNRDAKVNILDLSALGGSFGLQGDVLSY